jgi:UDP-N-acetylmuramoyl-L-alanyl-D-glutamate--2,6-diaminopimelate ligase
MIRRLRLSQLLAELPEGRLIGDQRTEIGSLAYDSRLVQPGGLFVALRGGYTDGHRYIEQAVGHGAVAAVVEEPVAAAGLAAQLIVPDSRAALARLASRFYDHPSRRLGVIGVTGTDGKTTTTYFLDAMLTAAGLTTGLIGTVALKIADDWRPNPEHQTTPESLIVQAQLDQMVTAGVDWAIVESTSHGLALHRLDEVAYDVAVLTNLSHEHLEFHRTFENYRAAKLSLFERLAARPAKARPSLAVVNADDASADLFVAAAGTVPVLRYGLTTPTAEVRATAIEMTAEATRFRLQTPSGERLVRLRLIGEFNVANALAAAAVGVGLGLPLDRLADGLGRLTGVPGRLERIDLGQPFLVVVDYAHTPESLAKVLRLLRPLTAGRLIAVFGSAGERDVAKRAWQGRISVELADVSLLTSEDPRHEDAAAIVAAIAAGAAAVGAIEGRDYIQEPDRQRAIDRAIGLAQPGDTVLLAGKGHEQSIIVGSVHQPWDDRAAARRALRAGGWSER